FTDRARRLKLLIVSEQGGFGKPVADLATNPKAGFEDCFVRAQYEMDLMNKEAKEAKPDESKRKAHRDGMIKALEIALAKPDSKSKNVSTLEVNTAKMFLTYYCATSGRYAEAAQVGEEFARFDPRSTQAAT